MKEKFSIPTVGLIIERKNPETFETEILVQIRNKPRDDPKYTGIWELPAGKIREFEDIIKCAKREVKEETGLELTDIKMEKSDVIKFRNDKVFAFKPFCCEQMLKGPYPYIGFVFIAKAKGELKKTEEAKKAKWINLNGIRKLIDNKNLHPYHVGAILMYLNEKLKNSNSE
jgi:8-oxo-dGTP pyrophosphatase MutT (NUDIX family)